MSIWWKVTSSQSGHASGAVPVGADVDWSALEADLQSFGGDYQVEFKVRCDDEGTPRDTGGSGGWRGMAGIRWSLFKEFTLKNLDFLVILMGFQVKIHEISWSSRKSWINMDIQFLVLAISMGFHFFFRAVSD